MKSLDAATSEDVAWLSLRATHARRAVATVTIVGSHLARVLMATASGRVPPSLCDLVVRLGPAYVKVAQIAATRGDLLPPSWCDVLGRLYDAVPVDDRTTPPDTAALGLSDAGSPPELLGAGSLATVWDVELEGGARVAVKVLRQGVREQLALDLALLVAVASALGRAPGLRHVPIGRMLREIALVAMAQTDLATECRRLERLAEVLAPLRWARVPTAVAERSDARALVMESIPPRHLRRLLVPDRSDAERRLLARRALLAVYRMLFVGGFVHCDLHPGNVYGDATGNLVVLDAGFIVTLDDATRLAFAQFFLAMARGDGERCAEILQAAAADPAVAAGSPTAGFRRDVTDLVGGLQGARTGSFDLAQFVGALFEIQRRHRVVCAPEFCFPLLTLLVVESSVRSLDPDLDFQSLAVPALAEAFGVDVTLGPSELFRAAGLSVVS